MQKRTLAQVKVLCNKLLTSYNFPSWGMYPKNGSGGEKFVTYLQISASSVLDPPSAYLIRLQNRTVLILLLSHLFLDLFHPCFSDKT
jgi:hypothetical protein